MPPRVPLPAAVETASYDPVPPPAPSARRQWWGRHLAETRWVLELARLQVDPVFHGEGVRRGDGRPVVLIPGFPAGDPSLVVLADWLERMGHARTRRGSP